MTGPGLPGRGVPPAQEVLDYIRFKFFKSAGQRELEELKGEELNVRCSIFHYRKHKCSLSFLERCLSYRE